MPHLVIVRRGHAGAYETLKTQFERDATSGIRVLWDRRQGERRQYGTSVPVERRVADRRAYAEPPDDLDEARRGERRRRPESRMSERRQAERRRRAPDTWGTLAFLVVHDEGGSL